MPARLRAGRPVLSRGSTGRRAPIADRSVDVVPDGCYNESMGGRPKLVVLVVTLVALAVAATSLVTMWRWNGPSAATTAELSDAVLRFELAKAHTLPVELVGRELTEADRQALQLGFEERLERVCAGEELARWREWDYVEALLWDAQGRARQPVGCSGEIVYWEFLRREVGGAVVVRGGVAEHYRMVEWNAALGRAVPRPAWEPGSVVYEYTLERVDGAWKVVDTEHWRFWDPVTGELSTGP